MGMGAWLSRYSYVTRIRLFIDELEERVDEFPDGYEEVREQFDQDLRGYTTVLWVYWLITATFYASIITSITASFGFKVAVFQRLYSILGFTSVGILYLITAYVTRLAWVDVDNSRIRAIAMLTANDGS